jgi:membrane protease YdiL (CAAX protease family)
LCAVLIFNYVGLRAFNFKETGALEFSLAKTEINFPLSGELGYQLLMQSNTLAGGIKYLLFCLFLVGLGEEIFWRGLIQQRLMSYLDKHVSVFLTAILFSSLHFYLFQILSLRLGIVLLVLIAFVGIIWGYLFWHYKNIWAPAISHGIVAFVVWKYLFFSNGS